LSRTGASLTQRVAIVAIGRAASTASIFAVNAILTRAWPSSEFGLFSAVWVLGNTLVPVFLCGLPAGLLYLFPRRSDDGRRDLMLQAAACLAASATVLVGVLYWGGQGLALLLDLDQVATPLTAYLLPFLPYIFSLVAGGYAESALVASGRPTWQAGLATMTAVGLVAAAVAGRFWGWMVADVLLAMSVVGMVRLAVACLLVSRVVGLSAGSTSRLWQGMGELLRCAWVIGLGDAIGGLSRSVDRLVVLGLFAVDTFGLYHVGAIEVPVSMLLSAVITVLIPEVSQRHQAGDLEGVAELWRRAIGRLALIVFPVFFFLFAFAGSVIAVYLPAHLGASEWVFRIFLLVLPLRCAVYNPVLVGLGRASWAAWGAAVDLTLNLILSVGLALWLQSLVPAWAFLGPAGATVLATYVQVSVLMCAISRELRRPLSRLLPWGRLMRLCGGCLVAVLVSRVAAAPVAGAAAHLLVGAVVFGGVEACLLWRHQGDRHELVHVLRSLTGGPKP